MFDRGKCLDKSRSHTAGQQKNDQEEEKEQYVK